MADVKISGLTAATAAAAANEFAINEAGTSKKVTAAQLRDFIRTLISGSSGTASQGAAPSETWQVLTSNAATNSTTNLTTVMTTSSLPAGTYLYRYAVLCQSAATSTAHTFSVDATGTVTKHLTRLMFPSQGVSAATGTVDQELNSTTGAIVGHLSTRVDASALGPLAAIDTADADVLYLIDGVLITSTSGNLLLAHASELAAASTVTAGTMLYLQRMA